MKNYDPKKVYLVIDGKIIMGRPKGGIVMRHEKYGELNICPTGIKKEYGEHVIVSECHYQNLSFVRCTIYYNVKSALSLMQTSIEALNLKIEECKSLLLNGKEIDTK